MEFQTEVQGKVYEKVQQFMREIYGEMATMPPDAAVFLIQYGSTVTQVFVSPWGTDDAVILVRAYVVFQPDLRPDLLKYLLTENDSKRFGAFGIDKDGDIFFEHSIVGTTCDKGELKASVMAVVSTADQYDDQIVQRWGGQRDADRHSK